MTDGAKNRKKEDTLIFQNMLKQEKKHCQIEVNRKNENFHKIQSNDTSRYRFKTYYYNSKDMKSFQIDNEKNLKLFWFKIEYKMHDKNHSYSTTFSFELH